MVQKCCTILLLLADHGGKEEKRGDMVCCKAMLLLAGHGGKGEKRGLWLVLAFFVVEWGGAPPLLLAAVVACQRGEVCVGVFLVERTSDLELFSVGLLVARSVILLDSMAVGQPLRHCFGSERRRSCYSTPSDLSPSVVQQATLEGSPSI
jgi:hypothetical protein